MARSMVTGGQLLTSHLSPLRLSPLTPHSSPLTSHFSLPTSYFSHEPVLGPTPPFPRRPPWPEHVGRLAVHAVGRVNPEFVAHALVHPRGAYMEVEVRQLGRDIRTHQQM